MAVDKATIIRDYKEGASAAEVARRNKTTPSYVYQVLWGAGVERHKPKPGGAPKSEGVSVGERSRRYRERRRKLGLCPRCPRPAAPGRDHCPGCLEKIKARNKVRYAKTDRKALNERLRKKFRDRVARGVCPLCAGEPRPGRKYCATHAARESADGQKRKMRDVCSCGAPKQPGKCQCYGCSRKAWAARGELMRQRAERGECLYCGGAKELPARKSCDKCATARREWGRRMCAQRLQAGLCCLCGKTPFVPGNRHCERCYLRKLSRSHFRTCGKAAALLGKFRRAGGRCPYSGRSLTIGVDAELDHRVPLARGGATTLKNLHWVHVTANRMKGDMLEPEFFAYVRELHAHLPPE